MSLLRLPKVYTILPGIPFARALATQLWNEYKNDLAALSDVQIYLPNRRSVRALADMFLEISDGQATLLPRLTPLGDIDEEELLEDDPFILEEDPFLTPAIPSLERQLLLSQLILARKDIPLTVSEAFRLAGNLARFLDRAHTEQIDLSKLEDLVTGDLAAHWQITKEFLTIITHAWPQILQDLQQSDPAERRNVIFQKKIETLRANPPQHRVIAAGSTGSIPATARLLDMISRLPNGCVVLPGFDPSISDELWEAIDDVHPYHYQKRLIQMMDIDRRSVELWPDQNITREQQTKLAMTHFSMQPQSIFDLSNATIDTNDLKDLEFISAEHPFHEAKIIALHLRNVLNTAQQTAMVVTPDRLLAEYIQQEMLRWDVAVNDSAGKQLNDTTIGSFLQLIAAFPETSAPQTHILSILRHPYFRLHAPAENRQQDIENLETALRDKFLPRGGLSEFAQTYDVPLLKDTLAALDQFFVQKKQPLQQWLEIHIHASEALATTPNLPGADILWRYEEGEAAAQLLHQLHQASGNSSIEMTVQDYADFISSAMAQIVVRPRFGTHPRLRILSPIEARMQDADVIILAGLNETVWPASVTADLWLSRPMQKEMKFGSPDRRIGQSALDFQLLVCASRVIVTWSKKREGILSHPSRWLQQIFAVLKKNDALPAFDASDYYRWTLGWDEPATLAPWPAPEYTPPLKARPRKLAVTSIEKLLQDPYTVFARHVLKLYPSENLDRTPDARDWGNAAHTILENFFRDKAHQKPNPAQYFDELAHGALKDYPLNKAQEKAWLGKLAAIRDWLLAQDFTSLGVSHTENNLAMSFKLPDGTDFKLTGRADRIDESTDQINITDYKTGILPADNKIKSGQAPQLPLLGLLAKQNNSQPINLHYLKLNGKVDNPVDVKTLKDPEQLINTSEKVLHDLLTQYYASETPYAAKALRNSDYDSYWHLKRVAEWAALDESDMEEDP